MTAGLCSVDCASFGVMFRLAAESGPLLATMQKCAPLGIEPCAALVGDVREFTLLGAEGDYYRLIADNEIVGESPVLRTLLDQLARELMVHVANHAPDRVFMHAGVVAWLGRALVLPGASFAGKTTLVAELVRAGATYYSDEYAVIDVHGQVHPYARDLQMREVGGVVQTAMAVEALDGIAGTQPLNVSQVIFTRYVEYGEWRPEPVSEGTAVLEMMRHSIAVQRTPGRVMATLARMMATASAVHSERGEASEMARALLAEMSAATPVT
jgi:hypothetical protein